MRRTTGRIDPKTGKPEVIKIRGRTARPDIIRGVERTEQGAKKRGRGRAR